MLKSDPGDTVAHQQLADHQDKGDKGYQNMRGDKNNDVLKYNCQLWMYVFGICDMVVDHRYMYMWNETVAKRGSSEVASCLRHFFETYRTGAQSLVSYSGGCGRQNKSLTILGLYSELHQQGVYDILDHKFLTRGHTFLRNDLDFAQVEKRKSSAVAYLPSDWCKVVEEANQQNPFQVVQMEQRQFFNYKQHIEGKYMNRHIATGGSTFSRASDISRKKRQNFAGFSGANSRKKSADFAGFSQGKQVEIRKKMGRFRWGLAAKSQISKDFQGQIRGKIGRFHGKFRRETSPRNNQ